MRLGVLGAGPVAQALATGWGRHGHDVRLSNRAGAVPGFASGSFADVAGWADVVVVALLGRVAEEVLGGVAEQVAGKVVVDTTNPLDHSSGRPELFVGHTDSLGERLQRRVPAARVVKAYNTVGNPYMVDPDLPGGPPTMLVAGDDAGAKQVVTDLLTETGWETADLGGIEASRYLEPMCLAWVAYGLRTGTWNHAFRLLRG